MAIFASDSGGYAQQDVSARLDYAEDWSEFMALAPGDTIASSVWTSVPDGLVFDQQAIDNSDFFASSYISGGVAGTIYRVQNNIVTVAGRRDVRTFYMAISDVGAGTPLPLQTALFDRFNSVADFKASSLSFLDQSFPIDKLSDDVVWENLVAAEKEASHQLRVFFQPTKILPDSSLQSERDALDAAGTPYAIEDDYDWDPAHWDTQAWGFMVLRQTPIISIESVRVSYPSPTNTIMTVPPEWLQLDYKYGQLRFVPAGSMMGLGMFSSFLFSFMSAGRILPGAMQLRYTAGLKNAKADFPDLVNLVKRMATMRLLKNALLPNSASISADGLSESQSFDLEKLQAGIDKDLANLQDVIKGVRMAVL
jgi:hypothetical protein